MKTLQRDDQMFSTMYDTKCENGHKFMWVGDPPADGKIPEGTACRCGKMKAQYFRCRLCKTECLRPVPVSKKAKKH